MEEKDSTLTIAHMVLEYAQKMLDTPGVPPIPGDFTEDERFQKYHTHIVALREVLLAFAKGDLSPTITQRGIMAGSCKALQANLRHLVWEVQQVERGDYTQRVSFLGDFSTAFNSMVEKLEKTMTELKEKEDALTAIAASLQAEVRKRSDTLQELKKSEAKFMYMAQHDALTGTVNRRHFFDIAEAQIKSAMSLNHPCCVAILDVDHFKHFNDTYGHMVGDLALKHIVTQCANSLRQLDLLGRFGGEEFILFFAESNLQQGMAVAERIRSAVEKNPFSTDTGESVSMTASLGVAEITFQEGEVINNLIEDKLKPAINRADQAMYRAKTGGRNRVCGADEEN